MSQTGDNTVPDVAAGHAEEPSVQLLAARETLDGFRGVLPEPRADVLEIGCGTGILGAELMRHGYEVTGLEPDEDAAAAARERGVRVRAEPAAEHAGGPYDAVLFSRSLHHIHPLGATVAHALSLLRPGGVLLAEEFGRERADQAATAFFFDNSEVLAAAGIVENVTHHPEIVDPFERWQADLAVVEHGHDLHEAAAIVAEIASQAELCLERDVPYLWRHIVRERALEPNARVIAIGQALRAIEARRIAEGSLPPVGLLIAARRDT